MREVGGVAAATAKSVKRAHFAKGEKQDELLEGCALYTERAQLSRLFFRLVARAVQDSAIEDAADDQMTAMGNGNAGSRESLTRVAEQSLKRVRTPFR